MSAPKIEFLFGKGQTKDAAWRNATLKREGPAIVMTAKKKKSKVRKPKWLYIRVGMNDISPATGQVRASWSYEIPARAVKRKSK